MLPHLIDTIYTAPYMNRQKKQAYSLSNIRTIHVVLINELYTVQEKVNFNKVKSEFYEI